MTVGNDTPVSTDFCLPRVLSGCEQQPSRTDKSKRDSLQKSGDTPPGKCTKQDRTSVKVSTMRRLDLGGVGNSMHANKQLVSEKRALSDLGEDPGTEPPGLGHCEPPPTGRKKRRTNKGKGTPPLPSLSSLLNETSKWMGDMAGITWNANGLMAVEGKNAILKRELIIITSYRSAILPL